jgi:hypothetical protein
MGVVNARQASGGVGGQVFGGMLSRTKASNTRVPGHSSVPAAT